MVQREDDTEWAIKRRLALYTERTKPLVARYMEQDKLVPIDGTGDPSVVTRRLLRGINARLGRRQPTPEG